MTTQISHWVNGKAVAGTSGRQSDVFNPATGEVQAQVPLASTAEVDAAVKTATAAFEEWSQTPPLRRARVMFKLREILERDSKKLAAVITAEHGKVLSDSEGEITRGMEVVEFAAGIPHLLKGEMTEQVGGGIDSYSTRQPLGVCAGITPFNFPVMVPMWMFPVALACGNCFILKPSTHCCITPISQLSVSLVQPRSLSTSIKPAPRPTNASKRLAGPKTIWSSCPTPTWNKRLTR